MKDIKRILVLGGSSSILKEFFLAIRDLNVDIHATFRRLDLEPDVERFISKKYFLDLESDQTIFNFQNQVKHIKYDLILSLIGVTSGLSIEFDSLEHVQKTVNINAVNLLWLLPTLHESLKENGCICFMGSSAADGSSFDIAYSAAKAALRSGVTSYSLRLKENQSIYVLEPSLIEESTMYFEMSKANIAKHREKYSGRLLHKSDIALKLRELLLGNRPKTKIIKIRPEIKS